MASTAARYRKDDPTNLVSQIRDERVSREADTMAAYLAGITRRRMFGNARSMLASRYARQPNWVVAMEMFGVGSTYAWALCHEMGVDPDSTKASPFPSRDEVVKASGGDPVEVARRAADGLAQAERIGLT